MFNNDLSLYSSQSAKLPICFEMTKFYDSFSTKNQKIKPVSSFELAIRIISCLLFFAGKVTAIIAVPEGS